MYSIKDNMEMENGHGILNYALFGGKKLWLIVVREN